MSSCSPTGMWGLWNSCCVMSALASQASWHLQTTSLAPAIQAHVEIHSLFEGPHCVVEVSHAHKVILLWESSLHLHSD